MKLTLLFCMLVATQSFAQTGLNAQFEVDIVRAACGKQADSVGCVLYTKNGDKKENIRFQTHFQYNVRLGEWTPAISHFGPDGKILYTEEVDKDIFLKLVSNAKVFDARAQPEYRDAVLKIKVDTLTSIVLSSEISILKK